MSPQADWRFCQTCEAMFLDGFPDKGQSTAGGAHAAQGFNLTLPPEPSGGSYGAQNRWRND
jgi:hypothetical protein